MDEPRTWRDVQATKPDPIARALEAWHAAPHETERNRMDNAIGAFESATAEVNRCDEPGCVREASCGWPVRGGGYRQTCFDHWDRT